MNIRYKRSLAVLLALFLLLAFAFSMLSYATDATEEIGLTPSPWEYRSALISNSSVASSQIESILTLAKKEANTTVISKLRKILTRGTYRIAALGGSSWPYDNNMPNAVGSISASESGLDTTVSFAAGWGCFAYASFASSYSRGVNVSRVWNGVSAPSVSQIQEFFHRYLDPGEHVHFYYGGTEHSILYLASNSDDSGFYYAEWSGTIQVAYSSYSQFKDALDAHSGGSLYIQDTNTGVDVIDYIDTCSMSSTNAVFEANGTGGYIKSLPCSSQTNAESTTLRALVSGEVLTVTNTVVNLSGNTWYQISLNGGNYYDFSGHVDFVNYVDDVMISAPNPPKATLTHGQPFNLSETVSSRHVVTKITGQILGSAGSVVFSGTYTPNKSGSLNISGSTTVASTAEGEYSIGLTYKQSDTFNESYEDVVLSCLPISVTVSAQSPSPTPTATPEIIYGDANKDRAVTAADASLVLRWIVELAPDKEIDLVAANITGGSTVTAADAAMILRWVVNLESSLQPKS